MLAALLLAAAAVPQPALAKTTLPLPVFGYRNGVTLSGTNPRFDLYLPDYRGARRMALRFALQFPPLIDGNDAVTLRVGGAPVGTSTVAALRSGGLLEGTFAGFRGTGRMLDVSIEGYLTAAGRPCDEYDPRALWMRILPRSALAIERSGNAPSTVAEFFEDYDGRYVVDVAARSADATRLDAIALGYWLNQIERWRKVHLAFQGVARPPERTIVVGDAAPDLSVRDGVLYATPRGIDTIAINGARTGISPALDGEAVTTERAAHSPASLDGLGIGTRTRRGAGELSFPVVFTLGTFGGLPEDLHFTVELAHSAFRSGDRATVSVLLDGAVVNGFTIARAGRTERYDVPIDDRRLNGSNQLEVQVEFVPGHAGCAGARPSLSASLLGTSAFTWRGISAYPPTIGEFFNASSGRAGVTVSDPVLDGHAFALLDRLGAIDPNVTAFTFQRSPSAAQTGVKEAIYVAAPEALGELPIAFDPTSGKLTLTDGDGRTTYQARLDTPYGLMQTLRTAVPTLVLTYSRAPSALDALVVLATGELSSARYDVLLFNARGIAYTDPGDGLAAKRASPTPLRTSWPLLVAFAVVILLALILISRRARRLS